MKTFLTLPTDGEFYNRYATLVPTLDKLGYLAQMVSALTEFGIIYSLILDSLADFWPDHAPPVAVVGATIGTAFIEIGLRKFAPYSARAILFKRFRGLDGWITGFVITSCLGLLLSSGALSFFGSKQAVAAVAPAPELETTAVVDSVATADRSAAGAVWLADSATISQSFGGQITAVVSATSAKVSRQRAAIATYRQREQAEGVRYSTRRAQIAERITAIKAEGAAEVARLEGLRSEAIGEARSHYRKAVERAELARATETAAIKAANKAEVEQIERQTSKYGGGLAYFTVLCLVVFILSVTLKEIHRAGAGIAERVEPDAYTFEAKPFDALSAAVSGRINRRLYGIIHAIEKTTREAPEPVAAPKVWDRGRKGIVSHATGGVPRRSADSRRRWRLFARKDAPEGSPPAVASADRSDVATTAPTKLPADRAGLESSIISYIHAALKLESDNFHQQAESLYLQADDVIRAYLGPDATPENVSSIRLQCIEFINNTGPNPFVRHHRRPVGFKHHETPAATDPEASPAPVTAASHGDRITMTVDGNRKQRNCLNCGKAFNYKHWNKRYCSDACRIAAWEGRTGRKFSPKRIK